MGVHSMVEAVQQLRAPKPTETPQQKVERIFPLGEAVPESEAIDRVKREFRVGDNDTAWATGLLSTFMWQGAITKTEEGYVRTEANRNLDAPKPEPSTRQHLYQPAHDVPVMITVRDPETGESMELPHPSKVRHIDDVWYHSDNTRCEDIRCHGDPLIFAGPRP